MTSITKNDNRPSQNVQKKKDVKSFTFPSYPPAFHPHSFLWRRTGEPTHDLHHQEPTHDLHHPRTTTPALTKCSKEKKMLNRLHFLLPSRIPPTFFCGTGPENQHMTSITKNDNSGPHKMFKRKKMLNRLHFPPTLPHSTHILLWRRTGEPTHDLHHQERQLGPHKMFKRKKRC
ncbi:hypothetical protein TNCV_2796861 [Trichonephila clavipes]|nr:hypothetical protein TNCV_2796861 [Trichonephila clavipes]